MSDDKPRLHTVRTLPLTGAVSPDGAHAMRGAGLSGGHPAGTGLRAPNDVLMSELHRNLDGGEVVILPVTRTGPRGQVAVGVYVVSAGQLRFRPAVDIRHLSSLAAATVISACAAAAIAAVSRRPVVDAGSRQRSIRVGRLTARRRVAGR
jgi:hypothetical protein